MDHIFRDFRKFMSEVWKIDRKVGQILSKAFEECNISFSILKLLKISDDLSLRGLIALELSDKMPLLIVMLNQEIDESRKTFEKYKEKSKILGKPIGEKNMPSMSSKLKFSNLLKTKIMTIMKNFKDLEHPICYSQGGELLMKKFKSLQKDINNYEKQCFDFWVENSEEKAIAGLSVPLLRRKDDGALKVNFGNETMEILVDVRYLKREFQSHPVPNQLQKIFEKFEYFKAWNLKTRQKVVLRYQSECSIHIIICTVRLFVCC